MVGGERFQEKMNFKYVTESFIDKDGKPINFISRPKIEVIFRKYSDAKELENNPEFRIFGLVDSGADISYIPRQIAEILKLDLDESTKKESKSASESFWTFKTQVHLEIIYESRKIPVGIIDVLVPEKYDLGEDIEKKVLLGRSGLFNHYSITFNEDTKNLVLKKHYAQDKKRSHSSRRR